MKRLIGVALTTFVGLSAFAQGRVFLVNDTNRLVYLTTDTSVLKLADRPYAGTATPATGTLPSGVTLIAGLYIGTSSTSMTLVTISSVGPGVGEGRIQGASYISPAILAGTTVFAQVAVWDLSFADISESASRGSYVGRSSLFTLVLGASPAAINNTNPGGTVHSTWAQGTQALAGGNFGAIEVYIPLPEPTTLTLAGLGAASLLVFRRRKTSAPAGS